MAGFTHNIITDMNVQEQSEYELSPFCVVHISNLNDKGKIIKISHKFGKHDFSEQNYLLPTR